MSELLFSAAFVLLGGFVYGCTGFGFGLVMVPLVATQFDPTLVVPLSHLVGLPLSAVLAVSQRHALRRELLLPLIAGALVATPIGVLLLGQLPVGPMKLFVAAIIAIFAVLQIGGWTYPVDSRRFGPALSVGAGGGLLGAATGIPGPPVLLFLVNQGESKESFRATLAAFFLLTSIANLVGYGAAGLLDFGILRLAFGLLPAALVGIVIGSLVSRRLSAETFRQAVLVLALLSAIALAISALPS
jgi:uncharacterized membrane protein YfcA